MLQLRELLARSEIFAADYYLRRGAYVAAANRGAYVIDNYPDTVARADALARMVEAYYKLGRTEEANRSLRVLALNHPQYPDFDANGNLVLEERWVPLRYVCRVAFTLTIQGRPIWTLSRR